MTPTRTDFAGAAFLPSLPLRIGLRRSPLDFPAMVSFAFRPTGYGRRADDGCPSVERRVSLEGGLVVVGARSVPDIRTGGRVRGCGSGPRLLDGRRTAAEATAATRTSSTGGLGTRDLSGGVAQRGPDLIDLELHAGALLAFLRLVGALLEAALRDDAGPLGQRTGDVFGELAPDARAKEQGLTVLPLVRLTVERAGSGRDGEVRDCQPVLRVTQLGVGGEVSHHGDDGLAGHGTRRRPSRRWLPCGRPSRRHASERRRPERSPLLRGGPWCA